MIEGYIMEVVEKRWRGRSHLVLRWRWLTIDLCFQLICVFMGYWTWQYRRLRDLHCGAFGISFRQNQRGIDLGIEEDHMNGRSGQEIEGDWRRLRREISRDCFWKLRRISITFDLVVIYWGDEVGVSTFLAMEHLILLQSRHWIFMRARDKFWFLWILSGDQVRALC
jgi:hypothetical protein